MITAMYMLSEIVLTLLVLQAFFCGISAISAVQDPFSKQIEAMKSL